TRMNLSPPREGPQIIFRGFFEKVCVDPYSPAAVTAAAGRSGRAGTTRSALGEPRQELLAVALHLLGADARDRQQRRLVGRLVLGDQLERGVAEDHVGRDLVV